LHLLGVTSPSDRRGLEGYLAKPVRERSADEVARIVDLMDVHRSAEFAADYGHGIADAAHNALGVALAAWRWRRAAFTPRRLNRRARALRARTDPL